MRSSTVCDDVVSGRPFPLKESDFIPLQRFIKKFAAGDLHGALDYLARNKNCQKVAYALGSMFLRWYTGWYISNELKEEGSQRLREIVTNIIDGLHDIDANLDQRKSYKRVTQLLFKRQGFLAP